MEYWRKSTFATLLAMFCLLHSCQGFMFPESSGNKTEEGLACYTCNSTTVEWCGDDNFNMSLVDTELCGPPPHEWMINTTYTASCEKTKTYYYYIQHGTGENIKRYSYTRGCVYVPEEKLSSCEYYDGAQSGGEMCYCEDSLCNTASIISISTPTAFLASLILAYITHP